MRALILSLALLMAAPVPVFAVQPDEVLADAELEARARELSKGLRCLVCRNESIDESNADLARDLRILVRERLVAGDTDAEVIEYLVSRFGEYVLLQPQKDGSNLLLWLAGPGLLLIGLGLAFGYLGQRRRAVEAPQDGLSEAEKARLRDLMGD